MLSNRFEASPESGVTIRPRFNIAAREDLVAITNHAPETMDHLDGGLLTHWADDPDGVLPPINARAETAMEKPMFRDGGVFCCPCLVRNTDLLFDFGWYLGKDYQSLGEAVAMGPDYWIGELGRIHERSSEAIRNEQGKAVEPLTEEFNKALKQLKQEFPENEIVSSTEQVEGRTDSYSSTSRDVVAFAPSRVREEALHEIRSRCEKMANALGYELPERDSGTRSSDQMVMVSVEQEASQDVDQEVSVESIMQLIDVDPQVQGNKEEVKEIVRNFEEALEQESPDEGRLRQFIEEAKNHSTSVAAKMGVRALQAGAVGVLGL